MKTENTKEGTRQRLIRGMAELLQCKGFHGFGLNEVLRLAQASKGVLYYHFPKGKTELAIEAIKETVSRTIFFLEKSQETHKDAVEILRSWMEQAQLRLEKSDFENGCPLAAVALETTNEDQELRQTLYEGFEAIKNKLVEILSTSGMNADKAKQFATLTISAYEGALLQSRISGSSEPSRVTIDLLLNYIAMDIATQNEAV